MADIKFSGRTGARAARGYPGAAGAAGAARTCREFGGRGRFLPQSNWDWFKETSIGKPSVFGVIVFLWAMCFLWVS
jgi:hypothetical protein